MICFNKYLPFTSKYPWGPFPWGSRYKFVLISNSHLWHNSSTNSCWHTLQKKKKTSWSKSASELYRPSDRRLSAKWLPTCGDRGCHVVCVTDPYGRILDFLDRSRYFSIK
jgi:hypothetical protein